MSFSAGDAIALTKLAVDLYQRGFKVAKAAPDSFQNLLEYLLIYRNIIWRIRARFTEDGRLEDETAVAALQRSDRALHAFRPLVARYQNLASTHRGSFLRRLQYPFDIEKIKECKEEIGSCIQILSFYLTTSGSAELSGATENRVSERRPRQGSLRDGVLQEASLRPSTLPGIPQRQPLPIAPNTPPSQLSPLGASPSQGSPFSNISPPAQHSPFSHQFPYLSQVQRIDTLHSDATPEDENLHLLQPAPSHSSARSPRVRRLRSIGAGDSGDSADATSSLYGETSSRTSIPSHEEAPSTTGPQQATRRRSAEQLNEHWFAATLDQDRLLDRPDAIEFNAVQIDEEHRRDTLQMLDVKELSVDVMAAFERRANAIALKMDIDAWLLRAIWYLSKAREVRHIVRTVRKTPHATRSDWPAKVSMSQACADFLKACYIVRNIIFKQSAVGSDVTYADWKIIQDLVTCLHEELNVTGSDGYFEIGPSRILEQDLNFFETFCPPIEEARKMPIAMDTMTSPNRWLTVEMDDAGFEYERVFFRTFVNAKIGKERERMRSLTAPYMLILWSQRARSEMIVSLINQHGTVNLQNPMTAEDLQRHDDQARSGLEFVFDFPSQAVIMQFLCRQELEEFLGFPRSFFASMKDRDARSEEFLVFRDALLSFDSHSNEIKHRASVAENLPTKAHMACEISLYERVPNECWKTVRRLVISSAPDAPKPWCISHWLPLSRVQVNHESREVELSWSDCSFLDKKSRGNYDYRWSYIYNPDHPNFSMTLQFEKSDVADLFTRFVLQPFETPFNLPNLIADTPFESSTRRMQVWRIRDLDEVEPEEYLAIATTDKKPNQKFMSEMFFLHRDLDFAMGQSLGEGMEHCVQITTMRVPKYVSNMTDLAWEPTEKDGVPKFTGVEWTFKPATFGFRDDAEMARFVKNLIDWDLVFTCHAESVQGLPKTQHNAVIALWQKEVPRQGPQLRLTIRHEQKNEVSWTTAILDNGQNYVPQKNSSKMIMKNLFIEQGSMVDIASLKAHDPKRPKQRESNRAKLTITLETYEALQELEKRIDKCLGHWLPSSDLVYRTKTVKTSGSRGSHDSNGSRSHRSKMSMDTFKFF
ncbi:MAG: hypothetical protein M1828_007036 [Chrysothrix sp. TS-e1954]|nr:MAG: hypothetical protein M1828_007036 [Chrysothrix sp. TS-e1954]